MRILILFLMLLMVNNVMANQQIHASIPDYWYLPFVDPAVLSKKFNNIDDWKGYNFSFPKKQYINENIGLHYKDNTGHYKTILAKGTLDLVSYNPNTGLFAFKLTVDNLVFAAIEWNRSKTDIPIKGTFQFDSNHTNSTIVTGRYDSLSKSPIPTKNYPIFYLSKTYGGYGVVLDKKGDIPVTITVE